MSLFGLSEKRRIAELEKQVADQQLIIDKLINLSERSVDSYAKAHNIATEAIAIAKKVVDDPDCCTYDCESSSYLLVRNNIFIKWYLSLINVKK